MSRRTLIITTHFLFLSMTSLLADACEDKLAECTTLYSKNCNAGVVRRFCPQTCNACPINACSVDNGGCDHLCNSTEGVAVCSCHTGFKLANNSRTCLDIDECNEGPNPCYFGFPAYCVNNVGSYSCQLNDCTENGSMNYYRSSKCCQLKNSMCGLTASIKNELRLLTPSPQRVFGGRTAALAAWPWQAEILYRGGAHCGATLISDRWLVSAAHCFSDSDYRYMLVYLGQIRSALLDSVDTTHRQQRRIVRVITHYAYNNAYDNDIALVEMDRPVAINDTISPICLPCGEIPRVGEKCWVTGFGRTDTSGFSTSKTLQEVDVPVVEADSCKRAYRGEYKINEDRMMCAGYPEGGKDACLGDSGGPLACQRADSCEWYLAGVTSFGKGCGLKSYYGVYTNVVNYEDWIKGTLGSALRSCPKHYNPCRKYTNRVDNCYRILQHCDAFPHYMGTNCKLACCQLKNGEVKDCFDDKDYEGFCRSNEKHCSDPLYERYMQTHCKKTCNFCT